MTRPSLVNYAVFMKTVNVYEAKTHLSKLLEEVAAGKEIVIAKNGKPVADLKPHVIKKQPIKFGIWADRKDFQYEDKDIVGPDPDIIKDFEDSINRPFPE